MKRFFGDNRTTVDMECNPMGKTILIKSGKEGASAVITEGRRAVGYYRDGFTDLPRGTVVAGLIKNYKRHLDAYFVDIGREKSGYLPAKLADEETSTGKILPLQVTRPESGEKGACLSRRIYVAGTYVVASNRKGDMRISHKIKGEAERIRLKSALEELSAGMETVVRTIAKNVPDEMLRHDFGRALQKLGVIENSHEVAGTIISKTDGADSKAMHEFNPVCDKAYFNDIDMYEKYKGMFSDPGNKADLRMYTGEYDMYDFFSVSGELKRALQRTVRLKSGGHAIFDYAEAMCVIDVNSASADKARNKAETARVTNLEAAAEIAIQLKLRNIGGMIIVDFIQTGEEAAEELDNVFREHLKKDPAGLQIGGFTQLGNYEIIRNRRGRAIHEILPE
jgi:ribonuclease G